MQFAEAGESGVDDQHSEEQRFQPRFIYRNFALALRLCYLDVTRHLEIVDHCLPSLVAPSTIGDKAISGRVRFWTTQKAQLFLCNLVSVEILRGSGLALI